jgi:hypothetical protein
MNSRQVLTTLCAFTYGCDTYITMAVSYVSNLRACSVVYTVLYHKSNNTTHLLIYLSVVIPYSIQLSFSHYSSTTIVSSISLCHRFAVAGHKAVQCHRSPVTGKIVGGTGPSRSRLMGTWTTQISPLVMSIKQSTSESTLCGP